jgi:N-acetylglucosamine-6-phosphate deacetylase
MKSCIRNCRLISPGYELDGATIEIDAGVITRIYAKGETPKDADTAYDASGKMAVPGFIDIHSHGASGYDFSEAGQDGIAEILKCKLKEGVTTLIPTTLTLSEPALAKAMERISVQMRKPVSVKIPGVHLEGPFLNKEWLGAQNPAYARIPDIGEVLRLDSLARVLSVTFAIELDGGMDFIGKLLSRGIIPSCGHSGASYAQFCEARRRGLRKLTHFGNQMSKFHHREIGLVGGGLLDDGAMVEIICDRLHLSPDMLSMIFKSKPLESILLITDSVSASWMADGTFKLGGLDVVLKDGEARLASNGALAGSSLKFNEALRNAHEISGIPLKSLIRTTSLNQAQLLGLEKVGKIETGYCADISILDNDFSVSQVFVDGVPKL